MKTSSCKAKGRKCAMECKELLLRYAKGLIQEGDVLITSAGVTGEDIVLSPLARSIYNFAIECKNQEKLNIWSALEQASEHAGETDRTPILFFRRNRSKMYVAMEAEKFMELIRGKVSNTEPT